MNKISYCYHTHTERCGHAHGSDEEFIQAAIDAGIKVLGFSDHTPLPNWHQPGIRMDEERIDEYVSSLSYLKEKYKDKIEIHIGLECEYAPKYKKFFKHLLEEKGIEYLVLGMHGYDDKNKIWHWFTNPKTPQNIDRYYYLCNKALKSGLFKYWAHPDVIMNGRLKFGFRERILFNKLALTASRRGIYMEVNMQGILNNTDKNGNIRPFTYPSLDAFKMMALLPNSKFVIGYDAHNVNAFKDEKRLAYVESILEQANAKYDLDFPFENIKYKK